MAETLEIESPHFVLDEARMDRELDNPALAGKRRTTIESVGDGFGILVAAGLIYEGMVDDPALYPAKDGKIVEGTYGSLASDCDPDLLSHQWPVGILHHLKFIADAQPRLQGVLRQMKREAGARRRPHERAGG